MIYSFLRKVPEGILFEGFDKIGDHFMAHIASDTGKVYLDGTIREETFGSVCFRIVTIRGKRICTDPLFFALAERFHICNHPYFLLDERLYARSKWDFD